MCSLVQRGWHTALVVCVLAGLMAVDLAALSSASGQGTPSTIAGAAGPQPRLADLPPFDQITLDKANESRVLRVEPLPAELRRPGIRRPPTEKLRIRLVETGREYEVNWGSIAKVELYEQLVLAQTLQFLDEGRLDDAYDQIAFLLRHYPRTSGLVEARQRYLYLAARSLAEAQRPDAALGLLEELLSLQPPYQPRAGEPPVGELLAATADALVRQAIEAGQYAAARTLHDRLVRRYRPELSTKAQAWQQSLATLATAHRDAARKHLEAGRFSQAWEAVMQMRAAWPEVPEGAALWEQIMRRYPRVVVAVEHLARKADARSLLDRAARRAGRLVAPPLWNLEGLGSEGGIYQGRQATWQREVSGQLLRLRFGPDVDPSWIVPYALRLVHSARSGQSAIEACWGEMLGEVRMSGPQELGLTLRQPHVLPEALVTLLPQPGAPSADEGQPPEAARRYQPAEASGQRVRYVVREEGGVQAGGPVEIVERAFDDPQEAVQSLLRGDVDVIERVLPADLPALASRSEVTVLPYAAPSVHVLLIRSTDPYVLSATFRRALVYGADRERLLRDGLARGQSLPGCRVVSGPFAAATGARDEPGYAYDPQIEPRPYDPQLALALRLVAEQEVAAAAQRLKQPVPTRGQLKLAHPAQELARIACRGLAQQWEQIGISCTLIELPPGQCDAEPGTCDLLYAELAAWEPLVDALRLFGPEGLVPQASPAVMALARQAARARNWPQVRQHLVLLHRLVHEELPLVPLWQWRDQYAFRRGIDGIDSPRLDLYQQLERWRIAPPVLAGRMP